MNFAGYADNASVNSRAGIAGMKVGGTRLIIVPPSLAYGDRGKIPLIPGGATVEFAVSLLSCKRAGSNPNSNIDPRAQVF